MFELHPVGSARAAHPSTSEDPAPAHESVPFHLPQNNPPSAFPAPLFPTSNRPQQYIPLIGPSYGHHQYDAFYQPPPSALSFPTNAISSMESYHSLPALPILPESSDRTMGGVHMGFTGAEQDFRGGRTLPLHHSPPYNHDSTPSHTIDSYPSPYRLTSTTDATPRHVTRSSTARMPPPAPKAATTEKVRQPRRETLRKIKHMIFTFRVDPWALESGYVTTDPSSAGSRTRKFISPVMPPPLLCKFRAIMPLPSFAMPENDDDGDEEGPDGDEFCPERSESPTFPYCTLHGIEPDDDASGEPIGNDGIRWLVDPAIVLGHPLDDEHQPGIASSALPSGAGVKLEVNNYFDGSPLVPRRLPAPVDTEDQHRMPNHDTFPTASTDAFTLPAISVSPSTTWTLPPLASISSSLTVPLLPGNSPPGDIGVHFAVSAQPYSTSTLYDAPRLSSQIGEPAHLSPPGRLVEQGTEEDDYAMAETPSRSLIASSSAAQDMTDVSMDGGLVQVLLASVTAPPPRDHVCKERPSSLRTHMTVHSGEKPFKCVVPSCRRPFSVNSNLQRHLRLHGIDTKNLRRNLVGGVAGGITNEEGPSYIRSVNSLTRSSLTSSSFPYPSKATRTDSILSALKKKSGQMVRSKRSTNEAEYNDENACESGDGGVSVATGSPGDRRRKDDSEEKRGCNALGGGANGGGRRGGDGDGENNDTTNDADDMPSTWVPQSLRNVSNVESLRWRPPFDTVTTMTLVCVPLPPVHPWGSPTDDDSQFEERDSWRQVSEAPYHPTQWALHPVLPGPAPVRADELVNNANFARRLMFPSMRF
ncbi:hypothetical protein FRB99_006446 [Tulasnella sp. 403]|nr:hypothetical protein FRB99_006446 [Tulasnella sp. 403]